MKIQCILKRDGGTTVDLGGVQYHFEPLADGAHVADVADVDHIDRFLAIPEGYRVYHGDETPKGKPRMIGPHAAAPAPATAPPAAKRLAGSSQHQPQYEIGATVVSLGDVVRKAFAASNLTEDEWNELDEDERAAKIDIALDALADELDGAAHDQGDEAAPVDEAAARAALVERYEARFGKKPHHRLSIEKIKAELGE
jgi:hypothetical protein